MKIKDFDILIEKMENTWTQIRDTEEKMCKITGESGEWTRTLDHLTGYHYFYNKTTGETLWDEEEYKKPMETDNRFNSISFINPCEHRETMEETIERLAPESLRAKRRFADLNPKILTQVSNPQKSLKKTSTTEENEKPRALGKYEMMSLEDFDPIKRCSGSVSESDTLDDLFSESNKKKVKDIISGEINAEKTKTELKEGILLEIFGNAVENALESIIDQKRKLSLNRMPSQSSTEITEVTEVARAEVARAEVAGDKIGIKVNGECEANTEKKLQTCKKTEDEKISNNTKKMMSLHRNFSKREEYAKILEDCNIEPNIYDGSLKIMSDFSRCETNNNKDFSRIDSEPYVDTVEIIPGIFAKDEIKRYEGYLLGDISIMVTSKKIYKKWSQRFFTFQESKLKLWKRKDFFDHGYPADQTISMKNIKVVTDVRKNTYETKKTKNDIIDNTRYCFELIRGKTEKGTKELSKYKISLVLSGKDMRSLQELNTDMKMVTLFNCK